MSLEQDTENNSTHTSDDISTEQSNNGGIGLPPVIPSSNPPQPPDTPSQPTNNAQRWWQDRKWILELAAFSVLFVYTIFSGLQWWHYRWANTMTREALNGNNSSIQQTLDRMTWQIKETHEIAKQTLTQAQQTTKLATDTHELAVQAKIQSQGTRDIAQGTAGQLNTMQTQLELAERPRVSMTPAIVGPFTIKNHKINVALSVRFHNSGHTPALLMFNVSTLSFSLHTYNPTKIRKDCQPNQLHIYRGNEEILPGGDLDRLFLLNAEVEDPRMATINPAIGLCATYRSEMGENVYSIQSGYSLATKELLDQGYWFVPSEMIPADKLALELIPGQTHEQRIESKDQK